MSLDWEVTKIWLPSEPAVVLMTTCDLVKSQCWVPNRKRHFHHSLPGLWNWQRGIKDPPKPTIKSCCWKAHVQWGDIASLLEGTQMSSINRHQFLRMKKQGLQGEHHYPWEVHQADTSAWLLSMIERNYWVPVSLPHSLSRSGSSAKTLVFLLKKLCCTFSLVSLCFNEKIKKQQRQHWL